LPLPFSLSLRLRWRLRAGFMCRRFIVSAGWRSDQPKIEASQATTAAKTRSAVRRVGELARLAVRESNRSSSISPPMR
jgi:hypothetical protein